MGTPGAGSVSPPTVGQKEGLSIGVWWLAAPQDVATLGWSPIPEVLWTGTGAPSSAATHHTPAQDTLHFSKGGHGGMPALIVEVPAAPEAACPWPIRLHGVGQLRDTLLWGCREGHWEAAGPRGTAGGGMQGLCWETIEQEGVQVPGHCLQQSEGLARTGLAQVSCGHCTFSQCTSPVVPCREYTGQSTQAPLPGLRPCYSGQ